MTAPGVLPDAGRLVAVVSSPADACLIQCAAIHDEPRILTFDRDFQIYRWGRNRKFEIP